MINSKYFEKYGFKESQTFQACDSDRIDCGYFNNYSFSFSRNEIIEYCGNGLRLYYMPAKGYINCRYGLSDGENFAFTIIHNMDELIELLKRYNIKL